MSAIDARSPEAGLLESRDGPEEAEQAHTRVADSLGDQRTTERPTARSRHGERHRRQESDVQRGRQTGYLFQMAPYELQVSFKTF